MNFNGRSNEDLVRLLYQSPSVTKPARGATVPPPEAPREPAPEPLASRRVSELPSQPWALNERKVDLAPLSDREERALFAALSKGTKANLGREPTVPELMQLVERVNDARAFVAEVEHLIESSDGVYIKDGRIVFSRPQRHETAGRETHAA